MRSCFVLGAGRSGTSMVAGSVAGAGYHVGDELREIAFAVDGVLVAAEGDESDFHGGAMRRASVRQN